MSLRLRIISVSVLAGALVIPASAVVVIDNFTQGATTLSIAGGVGSQESQQSVINAVGTQRDVLLSVTSNPFLRTATFEIVPAQGMAFYSSGPGVVGAVGLDYDGVDTENLIDGIQTAGPGLNLNLSAENAFRFAFTFADLGSTVRVDAYTFSGGSSTGSAVVSSGISVPTNVDINFSAFTVLTAGGVNWADVDRLVFTFDGGAARDFSLSNISAVPEPASMAALTIGALGLVARRRRRK
jgi:hypothetical protein